MSVENICNSVNLGTSQTLHFVLAHAVQGSRVLEVGCGTGALAKLLIENGVDCVAIDRNEECVAAARAIGVPALQADFMEFGQSGQHKGTFDAVLFTRSLHHILPLDATLKVASGLLKDTGKIIVDDFGAELIDEKTAVWFYGLQNLMSASPSCGVARGGAEVSNGQLDGVVALKQWRQHHFHKHGVAGFGELREALIAQFKLTEENRVPYLFRYFEQDNCGKGLAPELIKQIYEWERALCATQALVTVGVRWIGTKG